MVRNIKLKVNTTNLINVINQLIPSSSNVNININILRNESNDNKITFTVYLEENKQTFTVLTTNQYIYDWEFVDNVTQVQLQPRKTVDINTTTTTPELNITDFNELATLIEAMWKVGYKSPNILMNSNMAKELIKEKYNEVAGEIVTVDHALLKMILENFYGNTDIIEATEDTKQKMESLWKNMRDYTSLSSITAKLFKK
jgi:hypothetical protein